MAFRLARRTPLDQDARRLADAELGAAIERLTDLAGAPGPRVHAARKSIKRVRALLRLVRAALPAQRFKRHNLALGEAGRGLSAARDAAVALATFDLLVPADDPLAALRADLVARQTGALAADPDTLRAAAEALTQARAALQGDLHGLRWSTLEAGLKDSYGGGRRAMRAALGGADDEAFHAWRKRAKDLWYQCQLLLGACPELLGALEGLLAELGDRLGEDHDLAVLQAAAPADPTLAARISDSHAARRAAARELGRRIYAERPRAFLRRVHAYWQAWRDDA